MICVYKYDANNWLTNRWTPAKTNTFYEYDAVGNLKKSSIRRAPALHSNYDALNRLTSMDRNCDCYGSMATGLALVFASRCKKYFPRKWKVFLHFGRVV